MSKDDTFNQLVTDVSVMETKIQHLEEAKDEHKALLDKISENCNLLSQRAVATETQNANTDYMMKWILGVLVGSFGGILILLLQAYIK